MNAVAVRFAEVGDAAAGVSGLFFVRTVGTGKAGDLGITGPEGGFFHAERIEEALLQEVFVGHAADDLDDARSDVHALVAVLILLSRLPLERAEDGRDGAGFDGCGIGSGGLLQFRAAGESTGVAQDMTDGDGSGHRFQQDMVRIFLGDDHQFAELRDEFGDGVIKAYFAFIHEHHDGGTGEHLGHGSDPEDVVLTDWLLRLDIGVTDQVLVTHLAGFIRDDADDARDFVTLHVGFHRSGDFGAGGRRGVGGEGGGGKECRQ